MTGKEQEELVERLTGVGLDEREAKLYLHLCFHGPSRASDAAVATALKRTETYRALEGLMRRGFVNAHLTKPVVYEANAPEMVFGDLLASHDERKAELERLREQVASAVVAARQDDEEAIGKHGYRIIQGRRPILNHVETMLRHAQRSQAIASTTISTATLTPQNRAWQMMLRRASEGLPTRVIVRPTPGVEQLLAALFEKPTSRLRFFDPERPLRFVVVDDREVVCWLVNDPATSVDAREDVAMWTNAPDFVHAQARLFDALWTGAREVDHRAAATRVNG